MEEAVNKIAQDFPAQGFAILLRLPEGDLGADHDFPVVERYYIGGSWDFHEIHMHPGTRFVIHECNLKGGQVGEGVFPIDSGGKSQFRSSPTDIFQHRQPGNRDFDRLLVVSDDDF